MDLLDDGQYENMLKHWGGLLKTFDKIIFHMGTECTSLSRVRDRSVRTRLRSMTKPWGLDRNNPKVIEGNRLVIRTAHMVRWILSRGGAGSIENPARSYLWTLLAQLLPNIACQDVLFSACMFGAPWLKPTMLRVFGDLDLRPLGKVCRRINGHLSCGRSEHVKLGFGDAPTRQAAEYTPGLL